MREESRKLFMLSASFGLFSIVAFLYILLTGIFGLPAQLKQLKLPGRVTLTLEEAGNYTIFHEYQSEIDGQTINSSSEPVEAMILTITDSSGTSFEVEPTGMSSDYQIMGRSGYGLYELQLPQPGEYTFEGRYPEDTQGGMVVLSLAVGFTKEILKLVAMAMAALFIPGAISAMLLVAALKKRSQFAAAAG